MAQIELQDDIMTLVDNNGIITLIADTGEVCLIQVHPVDLAKLVTFLVKYDYSFT